MAWGVHCQAATWRSFWLVLAEAMPTPWTAPRPKVWSQCQWVSTVKSGRGKPCSSRARYSFPTWAGEFPASTARLWRSPNR